MSTGKKLKSWLQDQGMTQIAFVACMKQKDDTVVLDQADVSKWVNDKRTPNEHQRIVIQAITGISAVEWLPENLRKLASEPAPADDEDRCE